MLFPGSLLAFAGAISHFPATPALPGLVNRIPGAAVACLGMAGEHSSVPHSRSRGKIADGIEQKKTLVPERVGVLDRAASPALSFVSVDSC